MDERVLAQSALILDEVEVGGQDGIDISISSDNRFANVVTGDTGIVRSFRINPLTGALTLTATLKVFEGNSGMEGIAAE